MGDKTRRALLWVTLALALTIGVLMVTTIVRFFYHEFITIYTDPFAYPIRKQPGQ